jgi:hypothetical protein
MDTRGGAWTFQEEIEVSRLRQTPDAGSESRAITFSELLLEEQYSARGRQPPDDAPQFAAEASVYDQPLARHPLAARHGPSYSDRR